MSLLSSLGQAFHRVGVQTSVPDRLGTVRLALEGWREEEALEGMRGWRDPDGTGLSLAFHDAPFRLFDTEADLRRVARDIAESRGAGLIEATIVATGPYPTGSWIYKRREDTGYVFTGMLMMQGPRGALVWTTAAGERGTTGIREAVITAELMEAGQLTLEGYEQSWAQDPYDPSYRGVDRSVLRFVSDDPRYDGRFPDHPLSKVRRVLAALPASVTGFP